MNLLIINISYCFLLKDKDDNDNNNDNNKFGFKKHGKS